MGGVFIALDVYRPKVFEYLLPESIKKTCSLLGWLCVMFLWITSGFLFVAHDVFGAWGLLSAACNGGMSSRVLQDAITALVFLAPFLVIETLHWLRAFQTENLLTERS